jgi:inosose dehydratase
MHRNLISLSRRSVLGLGAAAVAGLALRGVPSFADNPTDALAGLPLGIQSYTLRDRSFEKCLDALQNDLKLSHIELYPGHVTGRSPTQVKELLAAHNVTATGFGVVHFGKKEDENRKIFENAKALGIPHLTCDPDPESFDQLDKLTEEYGITCDIHDHGPGHRWGKIDVIWAAIKDHSKNIGLCNDTGHFIRAEEDPMRACEVFGDRVHAMHVKDFKKNEAGKWEDCGLGEGSLKLELLMKWLLARDFKGDLSLEYEGKNPVEVCQADLGRIAKAIAAAKGTP